jgi:hypothetical protein
MSNSTQTNLQASTFIAVVRDVLIRTAHWRTCIASKHHSYDLRNIPASELLTALAAEPTPELPAETVARLAQCRGSLTRLTREAARKVGFRAHPPGLAEFIELVLALAADEEAAIAKVFSRVEAGR